MLVTIKLEINEKDVPLAGLGSRPVMIGTQVRSVAMRSDRRATQGSWTCWSWTDEQHRALGHARPVRW